VVVAERLCSAVAGGRRVRVADRRLGSPAMAELAMAELAMAELAMREDPRT